MAFQPVPDVVHVAVRAHYNGGGDIINNIYVVQETFGPWPDGEITTMLGLLRGHWQDNICLRLHNSYTVGFYKATDLSVEFGETAELTMTAGGQTGGVGLTPQNCILARLATTGSGAPRLGHLFFSPQAASAMDGNNWTAGTITAWQTSLDNFFTAMSNDSYPCVVVSRYDGVNTETGRPIPREEGIYKLVGNVTPRAAVASQRDRRPGEGS